MAVATRAWRFFRFPHDPEIAASLGKAQESGTYTPWMVADFMRYLGASGIPRPHVTPVTRLLGSMERVGLLLPTGWDATGHMFGQCYISQGVRSVQTQGHLWLSQVLGAELIIESYRAVTLRLIGSQDVQGTALVLDRSHLLTNRHVAESITASPLIDVGEQGIQVPYRVHAHPHIDVGVIEIELGEHQHIQALAGMTFREPDWADDVYLLGYPRVPMTTEDNAITVQRGEVVNPSLETPATGGAPRGRTFLYSAIARPGNSGGPIVAQDGRVIGLVVDHTEEPDSTDLDDTANSGSSHSDETDPQHRKRRPPSHPFYRGIPASEIMRALEELGLGDIAILENSD